MSDGLTPCPVQLQLKSKTTSGLTVLKRFDSLRVKELWRYMLNKTATSGSGSQVVAYTDLKATGGYFRGKQMADNPVITDLLCPLEQTMTRKAILVGTANTI